MKKYYLNLLMVLGISLFIIFPACDSKKKAEKRFTLSTQGITKKESSVSVWHKIKVSNRKGEVFEVKNPEIDYSDYSAAEDIMEDRECFGIRIRRSDSTETIPWETIKHIEITGQNKNVLPAKIMSSDGKNINAVLAPDSKEGLCGTTGLSGEFKIRLVDVKAIEVIH